MCRCLFRNQRDNYAQGHVSVCFFLQLLATSVQPRGYAPISVSINRPSTAVAAPVYLRRSVRTKQMPKGSGSDLPNE